MARSEFRPSIPSDRVMPAVLALIFGVGAAVTVVGGLTGMGGAPMPGGWTLSGVWAPLCGEGWGATAAGFLGMWIAMTAAMMTPVAAPALAACRRRAGAARTLAFGAGYLAVWTGLGVAVFAGGASLAAAAMQAPALARGLPFAAGGVVLAAGAAQFSSWKARRLAGCRAGCGEGWRGGLRLGAHCVACCAGPTAVLLMLGVMDLAAMAAVTAAIALERLAPDGARAARGSGAVAIVAGLVMIARAVALA